MTSSPFQQRHWALFKTLAEQRLPLIERVIGLLIAFSILAVAVFLYFTPWVQTTSGAGVVTAVDPRDRQQNINALVSGRIFQWFVRDGSFVNAGDPIVQLIDNDPQLIERLTFEREAVQRQLAAAQSATQTAELDFDRKRRLFEDGLASRLDVETARIKVDDLRSKQAAAEAELNRADVNLSRQSSQIMRAPRDGTILRVNAGDTATFVKEGDALASFLPANVERAVEIYIDGRDIALVEPGRKVRLQFEGWPAVQFSGWPSLAIGTFGGEVVFAEPSASLDGRFRVLVREDAEQEPWPEAGFVRFGAKARGWILLDEVRLGYELWRQLNNFPPNFTERTNGDAAP